MDYLKDLEQFFGNPLGLWPADDLAARLSHVPNNPGLYGFYSEIPLPQVHHMMEVGSEPPHLLYLGKATTSLRQRVRKHIGPRADCSRSTFRKSLASLIGEALGLELRIQKSDSRIWLGLEGERRLTSWMITHLSALFIEQTNLEEIEPHLIKALRTPLNIDHNTSGQFLEILRIARRKAQQRAQHQPPA